MPCSAPCNRLPCNLRCTKKFPCGHQCPSVCGEECPELYCQVCTGKKDARVDLLEMKLYREIDLDETPIVVLGCGHFFTAETLDGHIQMSGVYYQDALGDFTAFRDVSAELAQAVPRCPDCQCPIRQHSTQRYNRVINRAVIDEMSKRFLVSGKDRLRNLQQDIHDLEQGFDESRTILRNGFSKLLHILAESLLLKKHRRSSNWSVADGQKPRSSQQPSRPSVAMSPIRISPHRSFTMPKSALLDANLSIS